jgi:DNA-directed RNA polymerase specialized sigma24 family protein
VQRSRPATVAAGPGDEREEPPVEVAFYRRQTEGLLRRYLRISMEVGRTPACLPRETLRARRTSVKAASFEDRVIFVHDVERCIYQLDAWSVELLSRVALQEYSQSEASSLMGVPQRTLSRRYSEALDDLSVILLSRGLLRST